MSKRLAIAALGLLALVSIALIRRSHTAVLPTPVLDLPLEFVQVNPAFPFPRLGIAEQLKFDVAYAKAATPAVIQGKKIVWSNQVDVGLLRAVQQYCDFAGHPVYLESSLRTKTVGLLNFAALTASGIRRDFEKAMRTNQIAFVRDRTNGVWIVNAAHEPAFRRSLVAAQQSPK